MSHRLRFVCFGSSRCAPDSRAAHEAYEVGRVLGKRRITVSSGGYDGAMGAVSRGAREAGGHVLGVTTAIFASRTPNADLHHEFVEPDYPGRLATLLRQGHGFVALPGALGTASEWITAWCLATIGQLGGPLFVFEDPWRPLADAVSALEEANPDHGALLHWVRDARDFETQLDAWRSDRDRAGTLASPGGQTA